MVFTHDNATVYKIARQFLVPVITHQTKTKERREILLRFNAGTYPIVASAPIFSSGSASNYTITFTSTSLTVSTALLTITAQSANKTYGQTASFAGAAFTTSGLANGDTLSSVSETSTGAGPTAGVGSYNIVPSAAIFSSGQSSNYLIGYLFGTLTVGQAAIAVLDILGHGPGGSERRTGCGHLNLVV